MPLPLTAREQVAQAAASARAALAAGSSGRRQRIELLLPVNQRAQNFTNTDALDYPASVDAVHAVAVSCAEALIVSLGGAPEGGELARRRVGDGSDPCSVLATPDGRYAVVVTPSAEHLPTIRKLAERDDRTLLCILNPQWKEEGQVISDFGIGPWKKAAMDFLDTFTPTYTLSEKRIGAASTLGPSGKPLGLGGVARLLLAYPARWAVFAMGGDGSSECVRTQEAEPTYAELKDVFTRVEWSLRARRTGDLSQEEALAAAAVAEGAAPATATNWALVSASEVTAAVRSGALTAADVQSLDKAALRSALRALGAPSSGKLADLQERLRAALQSAPPAAGSS